jgi:hypothetical protein
MSTNLLIRLDPMKPRPDLRTVSIFSPEVCLVVVFQLLMLSNVLLLSFRFSYFHHPNTTPQVFYPYFAWRNSLRPIKTPIQNP